ncbi:mitochondrial [Seminavis robusta]|uniref:Mitochondrial n=1 Tax=Seminavis robusta TaxID=568900 RepID=A0A9N8HEJ8_9STRA|nr:mitochondrial [Seminavis robusta]|eukprot:Sro307_g113340.1 mitochondrial (357) ;mRNA; r:46860-48212
MMMMKSNSIPALLLVLSVLFIGHTDAMSHRGFAGAPIAYPSFGGSPLVRSAHRRSTRRSAAASSSTAPQRPTGLDFLEPDEVQLCSAKDLGIKLLKGAFLRVASDLSGGTPLESIKCRVTTTMDGPVAATRNIIKEGGFFALWSGTPSRTVEGALLGAVFILGSSFTKTRCKALGAGPLVCSLAGGLVGGVAQSVVMTPAGMIFTSLNVNAGRKGYENDNAITVTKRILKEKGLVGMYCGVQPMMLRQATNWASRAGFTEICRTTLNMGQYGVMGEIASGAIGGIGSCWNTPIETIRVLIAKDVSMGVPAKSFGQYWSDMVEEQGYQGLFRGVTPRGIQAIWQTVFMVVVPNMMGL